MNSWNSRDKPSSDKMFSFLNVENSITERHVNCVIAD